MLGLLHLRLKNQKTLVGNLVTHSLQERLFRYYGRYSLTYSYRIPTKKKGLSCQIIRI